MSYNWQKRRITIIYR